MKYLISILLILGGLALIINQAFLYSDKTTHPYLVEEMAKLYNHYYESDITSEQLEQMKKGATDEDIWPRNWYNHFYDPINNRGFPFSAKKWAQSLEKQAGFPGGDHAWQTAISEYNTGYKQKAFYSLGHVLHLIEDMAVPAHTREDPHVGGDPLENWAGNLPRNSEFYNLAAPLINKDIKPKVFNNLDAYFDEVANFSNRNFFSNSSIYAIDEKTNQPILILYTKYSSPKIVKEAWENGKKYGYGKVAGASNLIRLVQIGKNAKGETTYFIRHPETKEDSPEIHADYFPLLSKEAVINGAGVIKLFFDNTVEPAQEIVESEPKLSFFQKVVNIVEASVKFVTSVVDGLIHAPLPVIQTVTQEVIEESMPEPEYLVTGPITLQDIAESLKKKEGTTEQIDETAPPAEAPSQQNRIQSQEESENETEEQNENSPIIVQGPKTGGGGDMGISEQLLSQANGQTQSQEQNQNPEQQNQEEQAPSEQEQPPQEPEETSPDVSFSPLVFNYASSSITISWSSSETSASFDIEYRKGEEGDPPDGEAGWQNLLENTNETQIIFTAEGNDITYYFRVRARDVLDNESAWQETSIKVLSKPVVINEIAWMGTKAEANDEWIELFNKANYDIDLTGWVFEASDGVPIINLTRTIPANGYFLLERTNEQTISNITADQTYTGALGNEGENLILKNASGNLIDQVNYYDRFQPWYAGENRQEGEEWIRKTMERINPATAGAEPKNWKTYLGSGSSANDAAGNPILGTPKAKNSVYKLYTAVTSHIAQDTNWTKDNSPYLVYDYMGGAHELLEIAEGVTLIIEPGVIVKFVNPGLKVYGTIRAEGTAENPIVFTDYNDREYAGAIFGSTDNSRAGSWSGIWFTENSADSILDNIIIRYAGSRTRPFRTGGTYSGSAVGAAIRVENTSITLINSIIENNLFKGIWLINSHDTIIENSTFQNHLEYDNSYTTLANFTELRNIAIYMDSSSPQIINSTFQNNLTGIFIVNNSPPDGEAGEPIIEDNNFSDNLRPIWVENSYPQFSENQIEGNQWDGIVIRGLKLDRDYTLGGGSVFINYEEIPSWGIVVFDGYTLTIEPGTIIKSLQSTAGLIVEGTLIAEGTESEPIVFTSFYDDEYGGDTNGDNEASQAGPGSWGQIVFTSTSTDSSLNYVIIRYGGTKWGECYNYQPDYVLRVESTDLAIDNSIFENNTSGARLENSNSHIANTEFRNHQYSRPFSYFISTGLYLSSSTPTIDISTFLNNSLGIYIDLASWLEFAGLVFENNNQDILDIRPEPEPEEGL